MILLFLYRWFMRIATVGWFVYLDFANTMLHKVDITFVQHCLNDDHDFNTLSHHPLVKKE